MNVVVIALASMISTMSWPPDSVIEVVKSVSPDVSSVVKAVGSITSTVA